MIKYFHELSEKEFGELVDKKMTWAECAEKYPQPEWCIYENAVCGQMGCNSLMAFMVKNKKYCYSCELFRGKNIIEKTINKFCLCRGEIVRAVNLYDARRNHGSIYGKSKIKYCINVLRMLWHIIKNKT